MAYPGFVTDQNVFFNGTLSPCAVLLAGPPMWLVVYDVLDIKGQNDLQLLVTANGGSLPLSSITVAQNLILNNGRSWYDTYIGATKYVTTAFVTSGPADTNTAIYWDGTVWRYVYNGDTFTPGSGGGGGGGGPVTSDAVATATTLMSGVTVTGAGTAVQPVQSRRAYQAWGATSSGAGTAVITIEVSNDNSHWIVAGTISLTLSTTSTGDGFGSVLPYKYVRANVTTITGTGAAVSVMMGVQQ